MNGEIQKKKDRNTQNHTTTKYERKLIKPFKHILVQHNVLTTPLSNNFLIIFVKRDSLNTELHYYFNTRWKKKKLKK